jgi:hypothetical protein
MLTVKDPHWQSPEESDNGISLEEYIGEICF